jgi:hypothetical protein
VQAKANKRRGLRRLECGCGASLYGTWAQLERHGRPTCACGGELMPDDLELAMALGAEDAPVVLEYQAALASVQHGQAGAGRSLRLQAKRAAAGRELESPETVAAARVEGSRRAQALSNRLGALAPAAEPLPF